MIGARPIHLEVDGGINAETVPLVVEAGANAIVAGNGVFKGGAYKENIAAIRAAALRARAPPLRALQLDDQSCLHDVSWWRALGCVSNHARARLR